MKKICIDSLDLELTRRCNMKCSHCMRGDAQRMDMSDEIIRETFKRIRHVNRMLLTGGEVSLAPDRIRAVTRIAQEEGCDIDAFGIVTNGKKISREFIAAVAGLYEYCDGKDQCVICWSNDVYHEELAPRQFAALERLGRVGYENDDNYFPFLMLKNPSKRTGAGDSEMKFFRQAKRRRFCEYSDIIAMGRGMDMGGNRPMSIHMMSIDDEYGDLESALYVCANGRVLPDCDASYKVMDEYHKILLGVVTDPEFDILKAVEAFNNRIEFDKWNCVEIREYELGLD